MPTSIPKLSETTSGAGVGITNEYVQVVATDIAHANVTIEILVFLDNTLNIGANIIYTTSPNTGIPVKNPDIAIAAGLFFSPNLLSIELDIVSIAPLSNINFPNITPKPVTIPIPLNVDPNPPDIVDAISPIGIPTKIDVTNDVINNAINALSLNFII